MSAFEGLCFCSDSGGEFIRSGNTGMTKNKRCDIGYSRNNDLDVKAFQKRLFKHEWHAFLIHFLKYYGTQSSAVSYLNIFSVVKAHISTT